MKSALFFLSFLFLLSACTSGGSVHIREQKILHADRHLGEYLQVVSSEEILTVDRTKEGIALVNVTTGTIESLVPKAKKAKDLFYHQDRLIYREGNAAFFIPAVSKKSAPAPLLINTQELTSFFWHDRLGYLSYRSTTGRSTWVVFDETGEIRESKNLEGRVSHALRDSKERIWIALNTGNELRLRYLKKEQWRSRRIEKGDTGDHALLFEYRDKLYLSYLDKMTGVLKIATGFEHSGPVQIESVDGIPFESYRGMDLAIFDDGTHPGILYLDAWQLKLRVARKKSQFWESAELPLSGATGFYNVVLRQTEKRIKIATHNFRTDFEKEDSSFEDLRLVTFEVD